MSLLYVSSDSLAKIFECLGDRASTVSLLRRTCYRMDVLARNSNFHKVNAIYVSLLNPNESEMEGLNTALCRKKPKDEKEFILKQKNINTHYHITTDYVTYTEEKKLGCSHEQNISYAIAMLSKTLQLIKSVDELRIYSYDVDDEFVRRLQPFSNELSSIKKLGIYFGRISASPDQMTELIKIGQIESVDFRTNISPHSLQDVHLKNMRNIYLNNYKEAWNKDCPGITDVTIDGWMQKMPKSINMKQVRNLITFSKLWDFILKIVSQSQGENGRYYFGIIRKDEKYDKLLVEAQRNPDFIWKIKKNGETMERRCKVTYHCGNGSEIVFKF